MDRDGKLIMHTWEMQPVMMFIHHSTGLRFFCVEREPTGDDPDHWTCILIDNFSDPATINLEAGLSGMQESEYVQYLCDTAMEHADKVKAGK